MTPTDKETKETLEQARALVGVRRGPYDPRELRLIQTAAALIGDAPVSTVDRAICDCARKTAIHEGPHARVAIATPYDLQLHDANTELDAARRAEHEAHERYDSARVRSERLNATTTVEYNGHFIPGFHMRGTREEREAARIAAMDAQYPWEAALKAVEHALVKLNRLAQWRDRYIALKTATYHNPPDAA